MRLIIHKRVEDYIFPAFSEMAIKQVWHAWYQKALFIFGLDILTCFQWIHTVVTRVDRLVSGLHRQWDKIPQSHFRAAFDDFIDRLKAIIGAKGGQCEQI